MTIATKTLRENGNANKWNAIFKLFLLSAVHQVKQTGHLILIVCKVWGIGMQTQSLSKGRKFLHFKLETKWFHNQSENEPCY